MYKKYTLTSPQSIHWPKKEKYEANIICEEEARELLAKIKCEKMVIQTAIILGMCYGLRREEIAGLRWKDIDLEKNIIHICNTVTDYAGTLYESGTKTKSSNRVLCIIPFTADFFNNLMQWQKENNFFGDKVCLYDNGKPVAPAYLSKNIPKTLKKYGYDCVRLHDLRHTSASILANHVPITQVRDFCGHEDSKTTLEIYTHVTGADKLNTTNVLEKVFNASV